MAKQNDFEKIKDDLENLASDLKNAFSNLKNVISDEVDEKREQAESQYHKIKDRISDNLPSSNILKYAAIALVVGIVIGSIVNKKDE